jgi:hypothetical protein
MIQIDKLSPAAAWRFTFLYVICTLRVKNNIQEKPMGCASPTT